jgi:endonuclease G
MICLNLYYIINHFLKGTNIIMKYIFHILIVITFTLDSGGYIYAQNWEPNGQSDNIIKHSYYTLSYSEDHEQAEWVQYKLQPHLFDKNISRANNFREDPFIETLSAQIKDYKGSGYDRGHLAPAGDMKYNINAMSESFYLSNMSPQNPSFNRQIWRMIEKKFRDWASEYGELIIITAGVLQQEQLDTIGGNKITVPKYYYKVAIDPINYNRNIALLIENKSSIEPIVNYVVSIDSLESFTGIDFFHHLEIDIQNEIESKTHLDLWNWKTKFQPKYNNIIINTQTDSIKRVNSN